MDFMAMMELDSRGPDVYVGVGPEYPWGGLYGGQIVAQALRAADMTVEDRFAVHSLHAYFIRAGDASEPIRFEVDRLRNGRSFVTRSVVARQSIGAILVMAASFQVDEPGVEVQRAIAPDIPAPDELPPSVRNGWTTVFERKDAPRDDPGCVRAWIRAEPGISDEPIVHACAFAFASDNFPGNAVIGLHPDRPTDWSEPYTLLRGASLDHAIWFHRPLVATDWHIHEVVAYSLIGSRGVSIGHTFAAGGDHVATVTQEFLVRRRREKPDDAGS
jgi:acyl-CoA thioesterase II